MRVGVMQPYFFPYIGYFQLVHKVDLFVIGDTYQYTKKGWVNRNRLLCSNFVETFSINVKKAPVNTQIREIEIAETYSSAGLIGKLQTHYGKKDLFPEVKSNLSGSILSDKINLNEYITSNLMSTLRYLGIKTEVVMASSLDVNPISRGQERVIEICRLVGAESYLNLPGGKEIYDPETFAKSRISLQFIHPQIVSYHQGSTPFVPKLSIIDLMLNVSRESISETHLNSLRIEKMN